MVIGYIDNYWLLVIEILVIEIVVIGYRDSGYLLKR